MAVYRNVGPGHRDDKDGNEDGGRCLLAQAPTGIGKTLGTLFPLLQASARKGLDKLFFLTAKGTGHALALDALARVHEQLRTSSPIPPLRVLDVLARDKVCEHPDKACHGESCPLAQGFYDRLPAARRALAQHTSLWDGPAVRTTAQTSGMIFLIFIGADMINGALALSQLPTQLAELVGHLSIPPLLVMAGVMLFYVALGCVMDEMSMILLTVPTLFPVIMGMDFFGLPAADKALWFGILILTVCEIGMIFPPVGLNVYVMNGLARDVPMTETYKGVVPFLVTDGIRLVLLILFPGLSLWLVRWLA